MARRKGSSISIYTDIEIYPDEVLEEITDEELIEECQRRKIKASKGALKEDASMEEQLEDILERLRAGQVQDAIVYLDRLIHPKFSSLSLCLSAIAKPVTPTSHPAQSREEG